MAKTYEVVAAGAIVAGHRTGERFTFDYSAEQEAALIAGGAIKVVSEKADPKQK